MSCYSCFEMYCVERLDLREMNLREYCYCFVAAVASESQSVLVGLDLCNQALALDTLSKKYRRMIKMSRSNKM